MNTMRHYLLFCLALFFTGCPEPAPKKSSSTGSATVRNEPRASATGGATSAAPNILKAAAVRAVRKPLVRTTELPGKIAPFEETPIVAKIAGYVESVKHDIGDKVRKGEALAVLRAPELLEEVAQRKAAVAQAHSGIVQAEAGVKVAEAARTRAEAMLAELKAGVAAAEANLAFRKSETDRVAELVEKGSLTESRRDEVKSQHAAAVASLAEAKARLGSAAAAVAEAEAQIEQAKANLAAAQSQLHVAEAGVKQAAVMVDYLTLAAPFDGYVSARRVDTGHYVAPASADAAKSLFVVARADKIRLFVDVPEQDAPLVSVGDKATIRVTALGDRALVDGATVTRTDLTVDAQTGTLKTEIDLEKPPAELRPGMYAVVTLELARRDDTVVVPSSAVFAIGGKPHVVVIADGKAAVTAVERGLTAGAETEIVSGLAEGQLVVQKNGATIAAGTPIEGLETK
jgi:RND family efflux transporter MFP subunit